MYQAQRYFHTLELDKVLAKLADQANCDDSKRMALSLTPSDDFSTVQLFFITGGERKGCFLCEFLICNTVGSKCQLRSGKIGGLYFFSFQN